MNKTEMILTLHQMAVESNIEINFSPDGISLYTADKSDFTCQSTHPDEIVKAVKALEKFRKYWVNGS